MKKFFRFLLLALVISCNNSSEKKVITDTVARRDTPSDQDRVADTTRTTVKEADPRVLTQARDIMRYLKEKNLRAVSMFISPQHGIVFTADGFISDGDIRFSRQQLANGLTDKYRYPFPRFNESEGPITFAEYFSSYIYDKDYASAPVVEVNTIKRGPTPGMSNIQEKYPDADVVSFYFPPSAEGELDWGALHLVLVKDGMSHYLRHIVHDRWTP